MSLPWVLTWKPNTPLATSANSSTPLVGNVPPMVRRPTDGEAIVASVIAHYELVRGGQVLSTADTTKLRRQVASYKGPDAALLDKYLQTMQLP